MWPLRQRPPHLLSAGQQQRVAIAGALAMQPRYLVLDEATAMLDPSGRRAVLSLLAELKAQGLAILLITHFMNEAALTERAVVLRAGQVAFDGTPRTLFARTDELAGLHLSPTPLAELAAALARRWPEFPTGLLTVDELADSLVARLARNGRTTGSPVGAPADGHGRPLVVVRALDHTYLPGTPLSTPALRDVNLEVRDGEVLAVLGPTGSGKSSLLQHVAGLLRPSGGEVIVDGHPISARGGLQSGAERQTVAMLFQKPEDQLFETYVGDDVAFGPRQMGMDRTAVRERVRWAMEVVGLPFEEFKDRFTQSLSGGEKRKAALAGVLALQPRVLLLDEPTAGLDPEGRRQLLATLRHLNRHEHTTLVMATHSMEDVAFLADRALILNGGRIVAQGTPRQLFRDPALLAAHGLDVPQVTALMHRLRSMGLSVAGDVLTVQEALVVLGGQPDA
jgi:energy-coupling factor transporter ATPase